MRWLLCCFGICILLTSGCLPQGKTTTNSDAPDIGAVQKPDALLQGRILYQDWLYNENGLIDGNTPFKPVRSGVLALINTDGDIIGQTTSDALGNFQFSAVPAQVLKLRVFAYVDHAIGSRIRVADSQGIPYALDIPLLDDSGEIDLQIQLTIDDHVAQIFNILDVYQSALDFVAEISAQSLLPEDLTVYWQWASSEGSYTCQHGNTRCGMGPGIYVLSDPRYSGDTDGFDDDVLLHEFGHFLESSLGLNDSPGGMHSLSMATLDLRLSFSEGLASFFAISVKRWLLDHAPERLSISRGGYKDLSNYYIDTTNRLPNVSLDIANASPTTYRFATNEAAVAATLLKLQDRIGYREAWQSVLYYLTMNTSADTFEAYWDGLLELSRPRPIELSQWQSDLSTRQINYQLDSYEANNSISAATAMTDVAGYSLSLYRNHTTADADWYSVPVVAHQRYLIETYELRNGADTQLELFYGDGTPVLDSNGEAMVNDDTFDCELKPGGCSPLHDGVNFSSRLEYIANADETLFVRVTSSDWVYSDPVNYGYIGRYGSYKIRVTSAPQ